MTGVTEVSINKTTYQVMNGSVILQSDAEKYLASDESASEDDFSDEDDERYKIFSSCTLFRGITFTLHASGIDELNYLSLFFLFLHTCFHSSSALYFQQKIFNLS